MSLGKLEQLYFQNQKFGFYFLNLVTSRMSKNLERLELTLAEREREIQNLRTGCAASVESDQMVVAREEFWELRAAMSIAQLWRGRRQQISDLLDHLCNSFSKSFETLDLAEANVLFDGRRMEELILTQTRTDAMPAITAQENPRTAL